MTVSGRIHVGRSRCSGSGGGGGGNESKKLMPPAWHSVKAVPTLDSLKDRA
jgi:hypothetical protein